ncbi:MAG: MFS transporter [SAR202 cluster bacterium]|nr:MFS transporter [SAR202 cluster bacterium]
MHRVVLGNKKNVDSIPDASLTWVQWVQLLVVASGVFLSSLDVSVNVALPRISDYFYASPTTTYLMIIFYLGTTVSLQLTMGRAGDVFGLRKIFILGLVTYSLAMIAIGFSPNIQSVVGFRVLQAVGNSALLAIAPALATSLFPSRIRGRALGVMTGVGSVGMIVGTLYAGVALEYMSWRWIFFGRIPICILAILGSVTVIRGVGNQNKNNNEATSFDWVGGVLAFVCLIAFVASMNIATAIGWLRVETFVSLGIFICSGTFFVRRQSIIPDPLVKLSIMKDLVVAGGFGANLFLYMGSFVNLFILPYFVGEIIGASSFVLGIFLLLNAVSVSLFSPVGGYLSDRIGSGFITVLGLVIVLLALISYTALTADSSLQQIAFRMVFVGMGIGLFQSSNLSLIMGKMTPSDLGSGGAVSSMSRGLGSVTAVTLLGWAFTSIYEWKSPAVDILQAGSSPDSIASFMYAFQVSYIAGSVIVSIGLVSSLAAWIGLKRSENSFMI